MSHVGGKKVTETTKEEAEKETDRQNRKKMKGITLLSLHFFQIPSGFYFRLKTNISNAKMHFRFWSFPSDDVW